jgi:hypothetical protein
MGSTTPTPQQRIERLKRFLLGHSHPRLQMLSILSVAGLAGFLASVLLHWLGLRAMWLRYPIAVGIAYLVFLGLIGLWLSLQRRYSRARAYQQPRPVGTGGDSGAGDIIYSGADMIDDDDFSILSLAGSSGSSASSSDGESLLKGAGDLADGDIKGILILIVVGLIVVALCAALVAGAYVIWQAPVLFAEVLVNGGLMAGMARRLRPQPEQHWTAGVIRRTWFPALLVAITFCAVGATLAYFVPGAHSMGQAVKLVLQ